MNVCTCRKKKKQELDTHTYTVRHVLEEHNPRVYTKIEGELPVGYPGWQSAALKGDILASEQFSFTVVLDPFLNGSDFSPLHFIKKLKNP